jgi:Tol biopolymer transport system component
MTRRDAFEADLFSVFDADAQTPIPPGGLERLQAAIADRQPRPAWLAGLGGRWIGDRSGVHARRHALRATVPGLRLSAALLVLLLALALIGTAAVIGGRLLERPTEPEKLLYGLGGDIFLADSDGGNPTKVAEGADLYAGANWAPDGRHFVSFDTTRMTAVIRDSDGDETAAFDTYHPVWSPDSTRLQTWASRGGQQLNIYGIDGALQAELPLPDGYARPLHFQGVWAPDGRSVWVQIAPVQEPPCADDAEGYPSECAPLEIWELPIDGSAPKQVVEDLDMRSFEPSFSRDGTHLAFSGRDEAMELSVANADGTEARSVVRVGQDSDQGDGAAPIWSPSGEELAYITTSGDLKVVDVATGTARTLSTGWPYTDWPPHGWSRDGDRIMFSKGSGTTEAGVALGDLWAVSVDGGEPSLLVEGAARGAWQP